MDQATSKTRFFVVINYVVFPSTPQTCADRILEEAWAKNESRIAKKIRGDMYTFDLKSLMQRNHNGGTREIRRVEGNKRNPFAFEGMSCSGRSNWTSFSACRIFFLRGLSSERCNYHSFFGAPEFAMTQIRSSHNHLLHWYFVKSQLTNQAPIEWQFCSEPFPNYYIWGHECQPKFTLNLTKEHSSVFSENANGHSRVVPEWTNKLHQQKSVPK